MRTFALFLCLMLGYSSALVGLTWLLTEYVKDESCVGSLCASSTGAVRADGSEWGAWSQATDRDHQFDDSEIDNEAGH